MKFYLEKFPNPDQRTWGHWIRENSKEKALAIFLSCALWFVFVFQQGTLRRDFLVPIEYRNLASNWVLEEPKPKEATVTLVGRARAFDLLDPSTLKISLDMSGVIKEGTQKIFLSEDMIRGLSALSVAGVDPQEITLSAYQMISSNLPVEVRTNGKVPPGLILESIKASPDSIPVEIASKRLSGSLKAVTAPIDLASITETTTVTPKMAFPEGVKFADDKPPVVEVKVTVTKIQGQQPQEE
jgi:hypothetical protein